MLLFNKLSAVYGLCVMKVNSKPFSVTGRGGL
jgi:hypothetical protein